MGVLENPKHEAFAQGLAKGLSADQAYVDAGYSRNSGNANRMKGNESISARFEEIMNAAAEEATIDVARTLSELGRIGFSDIRQLFDEGGNLLSVHDLSDDIAAAVSSVEVVTKKGPPDKDGNRAVELVHKIKLWDKNSALEKIGKHFAMYTDNVNNRHGASDDLASLLAAVSQGSGRVGS